MVLTAGGTSRETGLKHYAPRPGWHPIMPSRSARSVALSPDLTRYVAAQVATARDRSASDVIRAAPRLLQRDKPLAGPPGATRDRPEDR